MNQEIDQESLNEYRKKVSDLIGRLPPGGETIWTDKHIGEYLELFRPFPTRAGKIAESFITHNCSYETTDKIINELLQVNLPKITSTGIQFGIGVRGKFQGRPAQWVLRFNINGDLDLTTESLDLSSADSREFITQNIKEYNVPANIENEGDVYYLRWNSGEKLEEISTDLSGKNPSGFTVKGTDYKNASRLPGWLGNQQVQLSAFFRYKKDSVLEKQFPAELYRLAIKTNDSVVWTTLVELSNKPLVLKEILTSDYALVPVFLWRSKSGEEYIQVDMEYQNGKYTLVKYEGIIPY